MTIMNTRSILFLKDGQTRFENLRDALREGSYIVDEAPTAQDAALLLARQPYHAVIVDLTNEKIDGSDILRMVRASDPKIPVLLIAGLQQEAAARRLVEQGATACYIPPFKPAQVLTALAETVELPPVSRSGEGFYGIIGTSQPVRHVCELICKVSATHSTVLVSGESGSGKELVARAIHDNSRRSGRPFVVVHCSAIPDTLLESELFGHERGAFTGAYTSKQGLFQSANGGTIFLDEIGEITPATQVKLLRVLESGDVRPVGAVKDQQVDVRVIAATNRNLLDHVRHGGFREDLFYRLNVFPINVPPLRERPEDIPQLAQFFIDRIHRDNPSQSKPELTPPAMEMLMQYGWPGNIRELENLIERAVILSGGGQITPSHLPSEILDASATSYQRGIYEIPFKEARNMFEHTYLRRVLDRHEGNVAQAARAARMSRAYFYEIIKKYDVQLDHLRGLSDEALLAEISHNSAR